MPGFQVVGDIGPALPRRPRRPVSLSPKAAADLFCSEQGCRGSLRRGHGPKQVRTTPVIRSCPAKAPTPPLPSGYPGAARNLLVKRVAVILVALAAGVIYADSTDPGLALGYQFLPDLPVGFTLSTYDALWGLGMEGTLSAGGSRSHGQSNRPLLGIARPEHSHADRRPLPESRHQRQPHPHRAGRTHDRDAHGLGRGCEAHRLRLLPGRYDGQLPGTLPGSPWRFGDPRPVDRPPISCTAAGVTPVP